MKTTQKAICTEIEAGRAADITTARPEYLEALRKEEHGFTTESVSSGTYGINGCIVTGNTTGRRYAVRSRSSNLFIVL